jgi:hypothetical protein
MKTNEYRCIVKCPVMKYLRFFSKNSKIYELFKKSSSQALVAHACNPSYLEDGDHEYCSSKPARANSSRDPILTKAITKKGLVDWLKW